MSAQFLHHVLVRRHGNDLEFDQIRPFEDPPLQERDVIGLHQQEAAAPIRRDPAVVHENRVRLQAAPVAEATLDLLAVTPAKILGHKKQHLCPPLGRLSPRPVEPLQEPLRQPHPDLIFFAGILPAMVEVGIVVDLDDEDTVLGFL